MVQWITHFENAQWKVESNALPTTDPDKYYDRFYSWHKSFVRVTWKVAGEIFCYITLSVENNNGLFLSLSNFSIM